MNTLLFGSCFVFGTMTSNTLSVSSDAREKKQYTNNSCRCLLA